VSAAIIGYNGNMKKILSLIFLFGLILVDIQAAAAATLPTITPKPGRFYIEVESYGRAWYINPKNVQRYYLRNSDGLSEIAKLALGISNRDLKLIPIDASTGPVASLGRRLGGYFLLAVEDRGRLWYVDPVSFKRRAIDNPVALQTLLQSKGTPIKDIDLVKAPMNKTQLTFDPTFRLPVYAKLQNGQPVETGYGGEIRPLASLTKLMTALVILDTNPNWERSVIITAEQMKYPAMLVGDDATSEVDFKAGDQIKLQDLWVAMLVASSNQAAVALADSTGLSRADFVSSMNGKAQSLGLSKTIFYDVAGLDSHNVSTAVEMAKMAEAAFSQSLIGQTTARLNYSFFVTQPDGVQREVVVYDRNYSLRAFGPDAAKTGFLVEAQRNAAVMKGVYVIVVLNAQSMKQRNEIFNQLWPQ
jgi:hypothetical protein